MTVSAQPLNIIMHSKTQLICLAADGPTGRRTYSTRETPALSFKEGGTKRKGWERIKEKRKAS